MKRIQKALLMIILTLYSISAYSQKITIGNLRFGCSVEWFDNEIKKEYPDSLIKREVHKDYITRTITIGHLKDLTLFFKGDKHKILVKVVTETICFDADEAKEIVQTACANLGDSYIKISEEKNKVGYYDYLYWYRDNPMRIFYVTSQTDDLFIYVQEVSAFDPTAK